MSKEAMKLALEALKQIDEAMPFPVAKFAQAALREALANHPPAPPPECQTDAEKTAFAFGWWKALESVRQEPAQQEPVACKTLCELCVKRGYNFCANAAQITPISSLPASKPWVGLTDEDYVAINQSCLTKMQAAVSAEAILRERNT